MVRPRPARPHRPSAGGRAVATTGARRPDRPLRADVGGGPAVDGVQLRRHPRPGADHLAGRRRPPGRLPPAPPYGRQSARGRRRRRRTAPSAGWAGGRAHGQRPRPRPAAAGGVRRRRPADHRRLLARGRVAADRPAAGGHRPGGRVRRRDSLAVARRGAPARRGRRHATPRSSSAGTWPRTNSVTRARRCSTTTWSVETPTPHSPASSGRATTSSPPGTPSGSRRDRRPPRPADHRPAARGHAAPCDPRPAHRRALDRRPVHAPDLPVPDPPAAAGRSQRQRGDRADDRDGGGVRLRTAHPRAGRRDPRRAAHAAADAVGRQRRGGRPLARHVEPAGDLPRPGRATTSPRASSRSRWASGPPAGSTTWPRATGGPPSGRSWRWSSC